MLECAIAKVMHSVCLSVSVRLSHTRDPCLNVWRIKISKYVVAPYDIAMFLVSYVKFRCGPKIRCHAQQNC